jgi:predicted dehydrogenase
MYKVGIIGLGYWYGAFRLGRALQESKRAKLAAVASTDEHKLLEYTDRFPADSYSHYHELLDRNDVEIVLVSPPTVEIPEYATAAAVAGKHILLSARIAMDMHSAKRLVKKVKESNVKVASLESEILFAAPKIREQLEKNAIGDIRHISCVSHSSLPEDWFYSRRTGWFADPNKVPGGAFLDYAIYYLQAIRLLLHREIEEVTFSRMDSLIHTELDVEDWGFAFLKLENGVTCSIETSWTIVNPQKTSPSPKYNSYDRIEITGSEGKIVFGLTPFQHEWILNRENPYWNMVRPGQGLMTNGAPAEYPFLDHLIDCIENRREPLCTCEDAVRSLAVILTAYATAKKNQSTRVMYD